MSKSVRIALGGLVSSLCLWLVFRNISFSDLTNDLRGAHNQWFVFVGLNILMGHALRAVRWQTLLSPVQKVPTIRVFIWLTFGFFMNNILPARAGELLRAYAMERDTGIPTSTCLGSIALERLSDLTGLLLVAGIAINVLPVNRIPMGKISALIAGGVAVALLLGVYFSRRHSQAKSLPKPIRWLLDFLRNVTLGFAALKSPSKTLLVLGLSFAIWFLEIFNVVLAAKAFSIALPLAHGAAVLIGIAFGVMIPAAPGFIGTYEFFGQQSMIFLGYAPALALSLIFSLHVFQLVVNSVLGLPGFFKVGWSPRR